MVFAPESHWFNFTVNSPSLWVQEVHAGQWVLCLLQAVLLVGCLNISQQRHQDRPGLEMSICKSRVLMVLIEPWHRFCPCLVCKLGSAEANFAVLPFWHVYWKKYIYIMNYRIWRALSVVTQLFWRTNEGEYYRCLHRPTLCKPSIVVISVPAWKTPLRQRSDKSSLKSPASVWLPAEISYTSLAPLNWRAAHEPVKVNHSSKVGRTEPRLTISQDEDPGVGYFHWLLPSAPPLPANTYGT